MGVVGFGAQAVGVALLLAAVYWLLLVLAVQLRMIEAHTATLWNRRNPLATLVRVLRRHPAVRSAVAVLTGGRIAADGGGGGGDAVRSPAPYPLSPPTISRSASNPSTGFNDPTTTATAAAAAPTAPDPETNTDVWGLAPAVPTDGFGNPTSEWDAPLPLGPITRQRSGDGSGSVGRADGFGHHQHLQRHPALTRSGDGDVRCDFTKLQYEVVDLIATFADARDLSRLSAVNRTLRVAARRDHLWRALLQHTLIRTGVVPADGGAADAVAGIPLLLGAGGGRGAAAAAGAAAVPAAEAAALTTPYALVRRAHVALAAQQRVQQQRDVHDLQRDERRHCQAVFTGVLVGLLTVLVTYLALPCGVALVGLVWTLVRALLRVMPPVFAFSSAFLWVEALLKRRQYTAAARRMRGRDQRNANARDRDRARQHAQWTAKAWDEWKALLAWALVTTGVELVFWWTATTTPVLAAVMQYALRALSVALACGAVFVLVLLFTFATEHDVTREGGEQLAWASVMLGSVALIESLAQSYEWPPPYYLSWVLPLPRWLVLHVLGCIWPVLLTLKALIAMCDHPNNNHGGWYLVMACLVPSVILTLALHWSWAFAWWPLAAFLAYVVRGGCYVACGYNVWNGVADRWGRRCDHVVYLFWWGIVTGCVELLFWWFHFEMPLLWLLLRGWLLGASLAGQVVFSTVVTAHLLHQALWYWRQHRDIRRRREERAAFLRQQNGGAADAAGAGGAARPGDVRLPPPPMPVNFVDAPPPLPPMPAAALHDDAALAQQLDAEFNGRAAGVNRRRRNHQNNQRDRNHNDEEEEELRQLEAEMQDDGDGDGGRAGGRRNRNNNNRFGDGAADAAPLRPDNIGFNNNNNNRNRNDGLRQRNNNNRFRNGNNNFDDQFDAIDRIDRNANANANAPEQPQRMPRAQRILDNDDDVLVAVLLVAAFAGGFAAIEYGVRRLDLPRTPYGVHAWVFAPYYEWVLAPLGSYVLYHTFWTLLSVLLHAVVLVLPGVAVYSAAALVHPPLRGRQRGAARERERGPFVYLLLGSVLMTCSLLLPLVNHFPGAFRFSDLWALSLRALVSARMGYAAARVLRGGPPWLTRAGAIVFGVSVCAELGYWMAPALTVDGVLCLRTVLPFEYFGTCVSSLPHEATRVVALHWIVSAQQWAAQWLLRWLVMGHALRLGWIGVTYWVCARWLWRRYRRALFGAGPWRARLLQLSSVLVVGGVLSAAADALLSVTPAWAVEALMPRPWLDQWLLHALQTLGVWSLRASPVAVLLLRVVPGLHLLWCASWVWATKHAQFRAARRTKLVRAAVACGVTEAVCLALTLALLLTATAVSPTATLSNGSTNTVAGGVPSVVAAQAVAIPNATAEQHVIDPSRHSCSHLLQQVMSPVPDTTLSRLSPTSAAVLRTVHARTGLEFLRQRLVPTAMCTRVADWFMPRLPPPSSATTAPSPAAASVAPTPLASPSAADGAQDDNALPSAAATTDVAFV